MKRVLLLPAMIFSSCIIPTASWGQPSSASMSSEEGAVRHDLSPDFTFEYDVEPTEIIFANNGKPKLPLQPQFNDKQGYRFIASAHGQKFLLSSTRKKTNESVYLIYDGSRWYSYYSYDNRMMVMPEGLISEAFFVGSMPMLWPGVGWPHLPLIQSVVQQTPTSIQAVVSDPRLASGMRPGFVAREATVIPMLKDGVATPSTITIASSVSNGRNYPMESWSFLDHIVFQRVPVASTIVWKTYKNPKINPNSQYDFPCYTYTARLVSVKSASLEEDKFNPLRFVHGVETGKKATTVAWLHDRKLTTFYTDVKVGDLETNMLLHNKEAKAKQTLPAGGWMIFGFFAIGSWYLYRRSKATENVK